MSEKVNKNNFSPLSLCQVIRSTADMNSRHDVQLLFIVYFLKLGILRLYGSQHVSIQRRNTASLVAKRLDVLETSKIGKNVNHNPKNEIRVSDWFS